MFPLSIWCQFRWQLTHCQQDVWASQCTLSRVLGSKSDSILMRSLITESQFLRQQSGGKPALQGACKMKMVIQKLDSDILAFITVTKHLTEAVVWLFPLEERGRPRRLRKLIKIRGSRRSQIYKTCKVPPQSYTDKQTIVRREETLVELPGRSCGCAFVSCHPWCGGQGFESPTLL